MGLRIYASSRPKIIGIIIGLKTKKVNTKIPAMIAPTMPFFMSIWAAIIIYGFGTYKVWEGGSFIKYFYVFRIWL